MNLSNKGIALFVVIALMVCGAIIAFALNIFKSGSIELLSQTIDQSRLQLIAESVNTEVVAILKHKANRPNESFWKLFREVFSEKNPLAGGGSWEKKFTFSEADLPATTEVIQYTLRREVGFEAEGKVVLTGNGKLAVPAYYGYIEIISKVFNRRNPEKAVKIKERREIRLANLCDYLDRYVLFVKRFYSLYNDPERKIILEGITSPKTFSRAYLGSSFYPPCPEFPSVKSVKATEVPPPIFLDLDFVRDKPLISGLMTTKTGFAPLVMGAGAEKSENQLFHVVDTPISFKALFDKGYYTLDDSYKVKHLQDYYKTKIVDVAMRDPSSSDENCVAYEIVRDYKSCGGDLSKAEMFQAVVKTCLENWKYYYGYTDYSHIFSENGKLTEFVKTFPFSGILDFFNEYSDGKYNQNQVRGGKMPLLFGRDHKIPVLLEGNVFLRFFKIAFFDVYSASIPLAGGNIPIQMPPFACPFFRPDRPKNFLSREVPSIHNAEKVLMSRSVALPMNMLYFKSDKKNRNHPEMQGGKAIAGDDVFPGIDLNLVAHRYTSQKEFLEDRLFQVSDGRQGIDIDGQMVIFAGGLDLRNVRLYRGRGQIVIPQGHCLLGSLERLDPFSNDSLKISLQNGSFSIVSDQPKTLIDASLVALAVNISAENGLFAPNKKDVEINGNLIVDAIADTPSLGLGRELVIKHDLRVFQPQDPIRVSISNNRSMYSIFGGVQ
jgi:hypothetical protein